MVRAPLLFLYIILIFSLSLDSPFRARTVALPPNQIGGRRGAAWRGTGWGKGHGRPESQILHQKRNTESIDLHASHLAGATDLLFSQIPTFFSFTQNHSPRFRLRGIFPASQEVTARARR